MRVKKTRRADDDLRSIFRYTLDTWGESQAEAYRQELDRVFALIGEQPRIGRPYKGRTRQFVHGKHLILYRVARDVVIIGRILHGARQRRS